MTYLNFLAQSTDDVSVAYLKFLLNLKHDEKDLHAFSEGHDDLSVYPYWIKKHLRRGSRFYMYECGGKEQVFEVLSLITPNIKSYFPNKVIFLVDKDFSDFIPQKYPKSIYVFTTNYYSIENYVVI